jgi:integrase
MSAAPLAAASSRSLAELVMLYYKSNLFKNRKQGTKLLYKRLLDQALMNWGRLPVRGFTPGQFEELKLIAQDTPHATNNLLRILRRVFGFAVKLGWIAANPVSKPGLLQVRARDTVWDKVTEERFLGAARPSLRLGFMLMLYTAQRVSDVLEMTVNRVSEEDGRLYIALRQQKTGTLLKLPVHENLEPLLRERLAQGGSSLLLVPSPKGLPWPRRNFSRAWDKVMTKAGLAGEAQRRDLRRTAVVRMAEAGVTTPQIAAVTGHGIDYCQRIIDDYLPQRTEVALAGIKAWEAAPAPRPSTVVVQLATKRPPQ